MIIMYPQATELELAQIAMEVIMRLSQCLSVSMSHITCVTTTHLRNDRERATDSVESHLADVLAIDVDHAGRELHLCHKRATQCSSFSMTCPWVLFAPSLSWW